jgi:hypothetical protein
MDQGPNQKADALQPDRQKIPDPIRNRLSSISLLCFAVVVTYVLGIGPAVRLLPTSVWDPIYSPLNKLAQHCTPLSRFLEWYVFDLWRYNGM